MTTENAGTTMKLKRARAARRSEAGFTLLETVIAMIVMMTVGLGASALFLYSITNNSAAASRSQALAIAQQQVEQLRSVAWDDPLLNATVNPVTTTITSGGGAGTGVVDSQYRFTISKTITAQNPVPVSGGGGNRMTTKLITITVTPVTNNATWSAGAVTITTTRSTIQRGPY